MKTKRITKKTHQLWETFKSQVEEFLRSKGATLKDGTYEWVLPTPLGLLELNLSEGAILCSVFTRFDDPERAKDATACNPYSGKWNHHYSPAEIKDGAWEDFHRSIERILVHEKVIPAPGRYEVVERATGKALVNRLTLAEARKWLNYCVTEHSLPGTTADYEIRPQVDPCAPWECGYQFTLFHQLRRHSA